MYNGSTQDESQSSLKHGNSELILQFDQEYGPALGVRMLLLQRLT